MAHGPEHHIEHAEHASHAAHDPFDRQVTMTIAIVAALLAAVTLLSHRAHNATLQLQLKANDNFAKAANEALQYQQQSTDSFTKASNAWNRYQSKKNRQYLYQTADRQTRILRTHPLLAKSQDADAHKKWEEGTNKDVQFWQKQSKKYEKDTDEIEQEARKHMADAANFARQSQQARQSGEYATEAKKYQEESKHMHHLGDRYDVAELGVEIGLVLCSLAVLTKRRPFWYSGMLCGVVGVVLMCVGLYQQYLIHH